MNAADAFSVDLADLEPLTSPPDVAFKKAFEALKRGEAQEQWSEKCEGLTLLRRLLVASPEFLVADLHVLMNRCEIFSSSFCSLSLSKSLSLRCQISSGRYFFVFNEEVDLLTMLTHRLILAVFSEGS